MRPAQVGDKIKIVRENAWCTDKEAIIKQVPAIKYDFYRAECMGMTALLTDQEFEILESTSEEG